MVYHPRLTADQKHIPVSHGHGGFHKHDIMIPVDSTQLKTFTVTSLTKKGNKRSNDVTHLAKMDNLPIPKEVNRKKTKNSEDLFLTPANGYGHHFTEINYLSSF